VNTRQRQSRAARRAREWEAFKAEHGTAEEWDVAYAFAARSEFLRDVLGRGARWGNISERQFEVLGESIQRDLRFAAEREAERATAQPVPTGLQVIEGTVLSLKWRETRYGSQLKMIVKGQGWKVWGSVPASLRADGVEVGDTVRFTATVAASKDDEAFGFFSRPRLAEIVERAEEEEAA
jgi:hypothetical protein